MQVAKFAENHSHISIDDFAATYVEEYGLERVPVKNDYLKFISHYIANNTTYP